MKKSFALYIKILPLIVVFTAINTDLSAQRWKRTRYEVIACAGPSFFMGEFGGSYGYGSHFLTDLDLKSTRYNLMVGARFKVQEKFAIKMNMIFCRFYGSDNFTTNEERLKRGGTFKTTAFETTFQAEYSLLKERFGTRYTFQYMKKFKFSHVNTYVFAGAGMLVFFPKTTYTYSFSTNKSTNYSPLALAVPVGIGFKYGINRRYSLGLEIGQRYTTSDYIDGWSDWASKGKDAYGFILVGITYKLKTARSGLPKF